ncbi:hypothetical protein [Streptomyces sp. ISL-100]|uniref:hypothetical protein n=1 Tax=Streptomyces sp. ISL-100 TaxID=2819173 RepID=UPI001BE93C36|nr:hypothetical protein [Streptomyces sp. ISL-100]MBT2397411.1 hypothetical protein [Streptomyces sp. ISL-100]
MTPELSQQLVDYERAVITTGDMYRGMSPDERAMRRIAAEQLAEHAPSSRTDPNCKGCDGGLWPCETARGAMVLAGPHYN